VFIQSCFRFQLLHVSLVSELFDLKQPETTRRKHGSVEDTKLSTNKQHSLSCMFLKIRTPSTLTHELCPTPWALPTPRKVAACKNEREIPEREEGKGTEEGVGEKQGDDWSLFVCLLCVEEGVYSEENSCTRMGRRGGGGGFICIP
jgi:hypothetical protein